MSAWQTLPSIEFLHLCLTPFLLRLFELDSGHAFSELALALSSANSVDAL